MASAFENRLRRTIEMAGTDGQAGPVPVMATPSATVDASGIPGLTFPMGSENLPIYVPGRPNINKVAGIGDSITNYQSPSKSPVKSYTNNGFLTWGNIWLAEKRLDLVYVDGNPGLTIAGIADFLPTVLATDAYWINILAGTNNLQGADTAATMMRKMVDMLVAPTLKAGRMPILWQLTPRDLTDTSYRKHLDNFNHMIAVFGREHGIPVVNPAPYCVDVDGTFRAGLSIEAAGSEVHPNMAGAANMGLAFADTMRDWLKPNPLFATPKATGGADLLTNPHMAGSVNGLATSWTAAGSGTATFSKVARADGYPGEWQQVNVTAGSKGFNQAVSLATALANGQISGPDDTMYTGCIFELDSPQDCNRIDLSVTVSGGTPVGGRSDAENNATYAVPMALAKNGTIRGVLMTNRLSGIGVGTNTTVTVQTILGTGTANPATARFGSFFLRSASQLAY